MCEREACKTSFESVYSTTELRKEWASKIDALSPKCACQTSTVSDYSRGPIENDEYLIRLVIAPQHYNTKKKVVKDVVLSHAETCGMSVFRDDAPDTEIMLVADQLVQSAKDKGNSSAGLIGVLRFKCADVRQFIPQDEQIPAYCIYDTAKKELPSHGDTFQRINGFDKNCHDIRRKALFALIGSTFVPTAEFRGGAFLRLAPSDN